METTKPVQKTYVYRDRVWWRLSALLYFFAAAAGIVAAGPLTWPLRAEYGISGGAAGVMVGACAGGALLVVVLSLMGQARMVGRWYRWFAVAAAIGTAMGAWLVAPMWAAVVLTVSVALVWFAAYTGGRLYVHQMQVAAESKLPKSERTFETAGLDDFEHGRKVDVALTIGGGVVAMGVAILGASVTAAMAPWFTPELPDELAGDGQVTLGEGPTQVDVLYEINTNSAASTLGDIDGYLREHANSGDVQFRYQGVAASTDIEQSADVLEGQACAWESGQENYWALFTRAYYQGLSEADLSMDFSDVAREAGSDLEGFADCYQSGKYEVPAKQALEESSELAEDGDVPQLYIDGESVQPTTVEEFSTMIDEAVENPDSGSGSSPEDMFATE